VTFPVACADVLAVRYPPCSWIFSCTTLASGLHLKRRAQHSRYSRNERSRFFLLTAPSRAKSSHTTWLQKYYSYRHCCLCKLHKTVLASPCLELCWCLLLHYLSLCLLLFFILKVPNFVLDVSNIIELNWNWIKNFNFLLMCIAVSPLFSQIFRISFLKMV